MWRSYHVDPGPHARTHARTHAPPPPPKKKRAKKGPPNGTVKDLKEHRQQKKIGGVRIDNLNAFPDSLEDLNFLFFFRGSTPPYPPKTQVECQTVPNQMRTSRFYPRIRIATRSQSGHKNSSHKLTTSRKTCFLKIIIEFVRFILDIQVSSELES